MWHGMRIGFIRCVMVFWRPARQCMSLIDLLRTALRSVSANKLRAALTMLGVVIGVASVIAMLALGNGARAAVEATFRSLGANQIQIGQKFAMQDGEFQPTGEKLTYEEGLEM